MELSCAIVLTTIYESDVLDVYFRNFQKYGQLDQVQVIVIPDKKTPSSVYERCLSLSKQGLKVECPSIAEQEEYLKGFGKFSKLIPYNSDNRRNVGYLMAYEKEVDFLISIDDDNFCLSNEDFFSGHSIVCRGEQDLTFVNSGDKWFNICSMLELEPEYKVYPRGFPYKHRHKEEDVTYGKGKGVVRLNAGLWLSEPDLDGITWLAAPVRAKRLRTESIVLGDTAWSPINTQNTALHRDVIPSYYFIKMGYQMGGLTIDRYGDIFSGYFSQACMRHLGHLIRVGTPVAEHRRNAHNYMSDATKELACIWVLEDLLQWLIEARLEGGTYSETYVALSHAIEDAVEHFSGFIWSDSTRGYFHQMAYCMREWVKVCTQIA